MNISRIIQRVGIFIQSAFLELTIRSGGCDGGGGGGGGDDDNEDDDDDDDGGGDWSHRQGIRRAMRSSRQKEKEKKKRNATTHVCNKKTPRRGQHVIIKLTRRQQKKTRRLDFTLGLRKAENQMTRVTGSLYCLSFEPTYFYFFNFFCINTEQRERCGKLHEVMIMYDGCTLRGRRGRSDVL